MFGYLKGFHGNFEVLSTHNFQFVEKKTVGVVIHLTSRFATMHYVKGNCILKEPSHLEQKRGILLFLSNLWINDMDTRERDESEGGLADD